MLAERVLRLLALALAAVVLGRLALIACEQLLFPFDLAYESPQLAVVQSVVDGFSPYDPDRYAESPFILNLYTPLYTYLCALFPSPAANPFFAGRLISLAAMVLAAAMLFVVGGRSTPLWLTALAAAAFFLLRPAVSGAAFMRSDPLALFLSVAAITTVWRGAGTCRGALVAAGLAVFALASKQSYGAALLAGGLFLAWTNARLARWYMLGAAGGLLAFGTLATVAWGQGFFFSVFVAPRDPVRLNLAANLFRAMSHQPAAWLVLAASMTVTVQACRTHGRSLLMAGPFFAYAWIATAVLVLTVGKVGAATNYFLEPALAHLLWVVWALRDARLRAGFGRGLLLAPLVFAGCLALELRSLRPADESFARGKRAAMIRASFPRLRAEVERLAGPDPWVLNLSDQQPTFAYQRRASLNHAVMYRLLWNSGRLDHQGVVDALRRREFDLVMHYGRRRRTGHDGEASGGTSPMDEIFATVLEEYELKARAARYEFFGPRERAVP